MSRVCTCGKVCKYTTGHQLVQVPRLCSPDPLALTRRCLHVQVLCKYETHTCKTYTSSAGVQYHDVSNYETSYDDHVQLGALGLGDQHGTETSKGLHNGAANCDTSTSVHVYHDGDEPDY